MKKSLLILFSYLFLTITLVSAYAYETLQGPTEVVFYNPSKAFNGYTLFTPFQTKKTFLINMEGSVVHSWDIGQNPRLISYNGHLLDQGGNKSYMELDWDSKVIWSYQEKRNDYNPHHDWVRNFNPKLNEWTTMYIANKSVSQEQAIAAGANPRGNYEGSQVDCIVEVDMNGNIIWEWWAFDHVCQDIDPSKKNYIGKGKSFADWPGKLNINLPGRPLRQDWLHFNSMDYNSELDHVVTNSVQGEFYVVDHGGTFVVGDPQKSIELAAGPKGDFIYRFGDPARYDQGDPPRVLEDWTASTTGHKQIGGSHDIQWIRPGLPGEGNFLIFNNAQYLMESTNQSAIFEINPFFDSKGKDTGSYINPPDAGYNRVASDHDTHKHPKNISKQIIWNYGSKSNQGFFSHIGSGAQRLPNGNTMICSMTEGHLFEITNDFELVWEYVNPFSREDGTVKIMQDRLPMVNALFRAYRYGPDHLAFKGKNLEPLGTITDKFPMQPHERQLPPNKGGGGKGQEQGGKGKGKKDAPKDGGQPKADPNAFIPY